MDRKRRVDVPVLESGIAHYLGGLIKGGRARILRRHRVNLVAVGRPHPFRSFPPAAIGWCPLGEWECGSASGTTIFISLIAIIGRKRTKRRKSEVKMPRVPMNVQMSTQVA